LVTFAFDLDLDAMRKNPSVSAPMRSTSEYHSNLAAFKAVALEKIDGLDPVVKLFGGAASGDRFRIEVSLEGIGGVGRFILPQEAHELLASIGMLYQTMDHAKTIARFFGVGRRVPATISGNDLHEIEVLYDLIYGLEVQAPRRIGNIRFMVDSERLAAGMDAFSASTSPDLSLAGEAQFPFLGQPVHVGDCVRIIRKAKMITRKSDIKRLLRRRTDAVTLRFGTTSESEQTIKLANPIACAGESQPTP
jgi:hypothetical protein